MPKVGMEPIRRSALVEAAIAEIGAAGHLDVTVGQIAKRAGVSSGLAHHYFGGKNQILVATMRHILREFGREVAAALRGADTPVGRAHAIVAASFSPSCFEPATVRAWMMLYAHAPTHDNMRRLLVLYQRRLRSNLTHALVPLSPQPKADAETLGALIDGFYLRAALARDMDAQKACDMTQQALDRMIEGAR